MIKGILADGESQSAGRMTTYFDAIQPLAQVFDGFLIHSRSATGTGLFAGAGGSVPSPSFLRTDQQPVLVFETETDTVGHFAARQPNSATYRLWEGTGTAHVDSYDLASFMSDPVNPEPSYPANSCTFEDNTAHERYLMNAAILRLSQWINGGTLPPTAPPIDVVSGVIQRDSLGIALDGIRLPEMDVPTLTQQGVGNTGTPFLLSVRQDVAAAGVAELAVREPRQIRLEVRARDQRPPRARGIHPRSGRGRRLKTDAGESDVP